MPTFLLLSKIPLSRALCSNCIFAPALTAVTSLNAQSPVCLKSEKSSGLATISIIFGASNLMVSVESFTTIEDSFNVLRSKPANIFPLAMYTIDRSV